MMKSNWFIFTLSVLLLGFRPSSAEIKQCSELKAEIEVKLKENGVKSYTLTIVEKAADVPGEVVGSCENGTKKIIYTKQTQSKAAGSAKSEADTQWQCSEGSKTTNIKTCGGD